MSNIVITRRIKFTAIYIIAFISLAIVGCMVGDYTLHAKRLAPAASKTFRFGSDVTYMSLPSIKFSIASRNNSQPAQVRMDISLEVEKKNLSQLRDYESILTNRITNYVQAMDVSDLQQKSAMPRLRQALLQQVNTTTMPHGVLDVVFRQLVIL